ncbi:MAG: DUF1328 domain-containing protein [Verrucomicrobiales bacterium]|nr:DUF1328 domain-containing protein [Verrucomicrobiales bacterium]
MITWAVLLLIVGLIAVALGFGGVGGLAMNIGWILLGVGLVLLLINAITGRRTV